MADKLKFSAKAASLAVVALACTASGASAYTLTCKITDYSAAGRHAGFKDFVPPVSTHHIDGPEAKMDGMSGRGAVDNLGAKTSIRYFGTLKNVGEAQVIYTYFESTGVLNVKTRGLRSVVWDQEFPERTGKYVVTGVCSKK